MPSSARSAPSVDVRTRILDAARDLLAESGVGELTQPKVSRAAGVSQSHLTYYFPRRADLLLAVARHALTETIGRIHSEAQREPGSRVERGAQVMRARLTDTRIVRLMVGLIVASEEDRSIKTSLREFIAAVRVMLRGALEDMGLAADDETVAAVHATAVGLAVLNLARDNPASRREVGAVMRIALERLARKPAKGARKGGRGARKR